MAMRTLLKRRPIPKSMVSSFRVLLRLHPVFVSACETVQSLRRVGRETRYRAKYLSVSGVSRMERAQRHRGMTENTICAVSKFMLLESDLIQALIPRTGPPCEFSQWS